MGPGPGRGVEKYRDQSLPGGSQAGGQTRSLTVCPSVFGSTSGPPRGLVPEAELLPPPRQWECPRHSRGASRTESTGRRLQEAGQGDLRLSGADPSAAACLGALVAGAGRRGPGLHPLRGLSAPPLGLLALSLFLRRRLSIQLELERVVKLESARELSRMFLPDMMSSPKPSWWEKA